MRVVWTLKKATSQQIIAPLEEKMEWKPATIKTLIGRLVKKRMLKTESQGKKFVYEANISEADTVKSATESLFAHICAKKIGKTIAELIEEAELTLEDIALIESILDAKKKEAVSTITCNCIPGQCECHDHQ